MFYSEQPVTFKDLDSMQRDCLDKLEKYHEENGYMETIQIIRRRTKDTPRELSLMSSKKFQEVVTVFDHSFNPSNDEYIHTELKALGIKCDPFFVGCIRQYKLCKDGEDRQIISDRLDNYLEGTSFQKSWKIYRAAQEH